MNNNMKVTVQLGLMIAILIVLAATPIGFIPIGPIRATTSHIPVIVGAVVLGLRPGLILGFVFGFTSLMVNTFTPTPTSFVFTPFYSLGEIEGNIWSLFIVFVPRILIGATAYFTYKGIMKMIKRPSVACALAGIVGSLTNTILVMSSIYIFFGETYAAARDIPYAELIYVILGIVSVNGILEAIVAAVLCAVISLPLLRINKSERR